MDILRFGVTLFVGAIGGWFFLKLNVPSAVLLGALFGVAFLNLAAEQAFYYIPIRPYIQIASGTIIGSRIRRKDIEKISKLKGPVLIVLTGMIVYNLLFGLIVFWLSDHGAVTAILATAPGGTGDLTLIAPDLGGNGPVIALTHVFRQIETYVLVPIFIKSYRTNRNKIEYTDLKKVIISRDSQDGFSKVVYALIKLISPLLVAALFGISLKALGLQSGMIVGAMIGAAAYSCFIREVHIPLFVRRVVYVFIGAYIGTQFSREVFLSWRDLVVPIAVGLIGTAFLLLILPKVLFRTTNMPYPVCILASAPLGLQEMTLMADDINRDYVAPVAIMHTIRLMTILPVAPLMAMMIEGIFE